VLELTPLVHRVDRRHHAAHEPDGVDGDDHLRHVLEHERHAVAGCEPEPVAERGGEGVRVRARLPMGDRGLEVEDRRPVGALAHAALEQLDPVPHGGLVLRGHVRVVLRDPRALAAHRATARGHRGAEGHKS
jgi:hypothetical protein